MSRETDKIFGLLKANADLLRNVGVMIHTLSAMNRSFDVAAVLKVEE
jgi:hypothetical protein